MGYECLHKLRSCKKGKNGLVALKLDVSKVYDQMEWGCWNTSMQPKRGGELGFKKKIIQFIKENLNAIINQIQSNNN